ncbi:TonB-dependent receptor [Limibacter armeniacum]|uniref:TonB-dependent receptor n=1 Tax=Limibacter armeniacum TaxID=466084 RepID=UPI002FE6143F
MIYFKHWSRKPYALFKTLGKEIKICTLATGMLAATPLNLLAQDAQQVTTISDSTLLESALTEDGLEDQLLSEVVVNTQRVPKVYSEQGRVVTVISREELKQAPVQNLQDLLEYVSGVDVRQRGPMGIQADISIRGGSFDQALVLLNGVNINNPQTGHLNLNLPVDLESVEAVEILQGPGSRVFGPNAFSGAINIITGSKDNNNISAHVMAGEHGLHKVAASGTLKKGKIKHYLSASKQGSDGYTRNTDFNAYNAFYQGKLGTKAGDLEMQLGYGNKAFGASTFYSANFPDQFEQNKAYFGSLKFTTKGKVKFTPLIYWNRAQDRFELFRDFENAASWYSDHNYHLVDAYGTNLSAQYNSKLGTTAVGLDIRSENIRSSVLGKDMDNPQDVPGENIDYPAGYPEGKKPQFTKKDGRENISFFLEHNFDIGKLSASAGLMANWNSHLDRSEADAFDVFPGIDLSYQIVDPLRVFGSVNTSMRIPTFTDLYYLSTTDVGNENLNPEKATTYEGGIKYFDGPLSGSISAFYREGKDIIDWVKDDAAGTFNATNIPELNTFGVDVNAQFKPGRLIDNFFIQRISLSYTYLDMDINADNAISKYGLSNLKHKAVLGINHRIFKNLYADWKMHYQQRNYALYTFDETAEIQATDNPFEAYALVDLRLYYVYNQFNFYVEASNLFDEKYIDFVSVEQPGRWVRAGLKIDLDLN